MYIHNMGILAQKATNGTDGDSDEKIKKKQNSTDYRKNRERTKNHSSSETLHHYGNNDKSPQGITYNLALDSKLDI
ncbi:hypothetical protein [Gelidibacter japonicus]|uniref:hypothetical protein n=1 Tax=Gelidibacter japonicus TaxID=1962232 RepID=UPI0013D4D08D|nr:hypothetical protein [Gelidibacter japonicus]